MSSCTSSCTHVGCVHSSSNAERLFHVGSGSAVARVVKAASTQNTHSALLLLYTQLFHVCCYVHQQQCRAFISCCRGFFIKRTTTEPHPFTIVLETTRWVCSAQWDRVLGLGCSSHEPLCSTNTTYYLGGTCRSVTVPAHLQNSTRHQQRGETQSMP